MPLPPGHNLLLSLPRRLMCDLMHFSKQVPLVAIERRFDLSEVAEARQALACRVGWFTLFIKAFGQVAWRRPELRRCFLPFPYPRLHQHACNVAVMPIERRIGAEDGLLFLDIRHPECYALTDLNTLIQTAKTQPLQAIPAFRRQLLVSRLPGPLRRLLWWASLKTVAQWRARFFGTFGVTGVAGFGAASLHFLSPLTSTLTFGVLGDDGSLLVRLAYDHRVFDGVAPALALRELEQTLQGPILAELRRLAHRPAIAA